MCGHKFRICGRIFDAAAIARDARARLARALVMLPCLVRMGEADAA